MTDTAARLAFFDAQAAEISHNYGRGRAVVAIDGIDRTSTAEFALALVEALHRSGHSAIAASIDDFVRPRAERGSSGLPPAQAYYDSRYDYATFRRVLVEPFRLGGSAGFVTAGFDEGADSQLEPVWRTAAADAILVVSGPFLGRPELRGVFNYTVYLDTPARPDDAAARDALERYAAEAEPRFRATAIVDVSAPELPRRVFADSC